MAKNDNARPCEHEHEPSLTEAGVEVCVWCGNHREADAAPRALVDVPVGAVVVEPRRAA